MVRSNCFFGFFPLKPCAQAKKIKTKNLHISKKSSTFAREFEKNARNIAAEFEKNARNIAAEFTKYDGLVAQLDRATAF